MHEVKEKEVFAEVPNVGRVAIDKSWSPPPMAQAWNAGVPLEIIRFAAANRLCIDLEYKDEHRIIEPYSLRRTQDGNILLHAVRHEDGQPRSYRVDRIQGAAATDISFSPRYAIELTASGILQIPETERTSIGSVSGFSGRQMRSRSTGPTYVVECSYCGKTFRRKNNTTTLRSHKDKSGYACSGRHGYLVDTIY